MKRFEVGVYYAAAFSLHGKSGNTSDPICVTANSLSGLFSELRKVIRLTRENIEAISINIMGRHNRYINIDNIKE